MASAETSAGVRSAAATTASRGVGEWFWRAAALRSARIFAERTALRRERLRRAQLAAELADRALEPNDPLRAGDALPLALSLYREAVYWALLARTDANGSSDIREAFALSAGDLAASQNPDELAQLRAALADKSFVQTADDRPEVQRLDAELSQSFVHALIDSNDAREDVVGKVLLSRLWRVGLGLVAIVVLLAAGKLGLDRVVHGPDLAAGKPWRASSKAYDCQPKVPTCGGAQTAILFHTVEEDVPWFEIDLGSSQPVGRIDVTNREDCCIERAVPLVVEVGNDQKQWKKVARQPDAFRTWETGFEPVKARYVRLRVERRSVLHLVHVGVHAR
jgi:hypothetical protein